MSQWTKVSHIDDIPQLGSRVLKTDSVSIAIFRTASDEVFALKDECPHRQGPLSQGIVHDNTVTCPLHNWKIDLASGEAKAPDKGCTRHYPVKIENGVVFLGNIAQEDAA